MMTPMSRPYRNLVIAAGVGLISDFWPIPGALLAAVVFREGIHSAHPTAYIALTLFLNFLVFGGLTYFMADAVGKPKAAPKRAIAPEIERPVKGIVYTESEITEFKRRGLM